MTIALVAAGFALAQDFDLSWFTIDGGSEMFTTGGDFELSGTIAQADAGLMSGGDFTLTGGFWFPVVPGDCNADGGVNILDFGDFAPCVTGPGGPLPPECACFDLDDDADVDLLDFGLFQTVFTGP